MLPKNASVQHCTPFKCRFLCTFQCCRRQSVEQEKLFRNSTFALRQRMHCKVASRSCMTTPSSAHSLLGPGQLLLNFRMAPQVLMSTMKLAVLSKSVECSHHDSKSASWAFQYLVNEAHMTPFVDYTSVPPKAQREPCIPRTLLRTLFCITALPIRPPDKDIGFKRNSTNGCIGRGYPRAGYRQVGSHAWPSPSFNPLMTFQCISSAVNTTFVSIIKAECTWGQVETPISGGNVKTSADRPSRQTRSDLGPTLDLHNRGIEYYESELYPKQLPEAIRFSLVRKSLFQVIIN